MSDLLSSGNWSGKFGLGGVGVGVRFRVGSQYGKSEVAVKTNGTGTCACTKSAS